MNTLIPDSNLPPANDLEGIEISNVIAELFDTYEIGDLRKCLWDWYKSALKDEHSLNTSRERMSLVSLYEHIDKLVIGAHKKYLETENQG